MRRKFLKQVSIPDAWPCFRGTACKKLSQRREGESFASLSFYQSKQFKPLQRETDALKGHLREADAPEPRGEDWLSVSRQATTLRVLFSSEFDSSSELGIFSIRNPWTNTSHNIFRPSRSLTPFYHLVNSPYETKCMGNFCL